MPRTKKRTLGSNSRAVAPSLPYEPWLIEQLKDPDEAADYLEAVIEDGDPDAIVIALRQLARAGHKV